MILYAEIEPIINVSRESFEMSLVGALLAILKERWFFSYLVS